MQTTTRPVTFAEVDHHSRRVVATRTLPAGTAVHARTNRRGQLIVRVCGTLLEQTVTPSTITAR